MQDEGNRPIVNIIEPPFFILALLAAWIGAQTLISNPSLIEPTSLSLKGWICKLVPLV